MRRVVMIVAGLFIAGFAGVWLRGLAQNSAPDPAVPLQNPGVTYRADDPDFYIYRVKPILQVNCYRCHAGMNHKGGLNLDTRAGMMKGGHDGSALVAGDPTRSMLVTLIRHEGPKNDPMPMPPAPRKKLSDADIDTVTRWVAAGAIMPPEMGTH